MDDQQQPSALPDLASNACSKQGKKQGAVSQFVRWIDAYIMGYDVFVSYTWSDGRQYAERLASALKKKRYRCFLDSSEYKAGADLNRDARRAVRRSSAAAIVITPSALRSHHVRKEILLFDQAEKPLVPIDVKETMYVRQDTNGDGELWSHSSNIAQMLADVDETQRKEIQNVLDRISRDTKIQITEGSAEQPSPSRVE